jgi:hypothetical protein
MKKIILVKLTKKDRQKRKDRIQARIEQVSDEAYQQGVQEGLKRNLEVFAAILFSTLNEPGVVNKDFTFEKSLIGRVGMEEVFPLGSAGSGKRTFRIWAKDYEP